MALIFCLTSAASGINLEKKIIRKKLKNGMTVLMVERRLSPTVSLYIRHRIGSLDEAEGESGTAHLLEHMMFKGTTTIGAKNYQEEKKILAEIEEAGEALDREKSKGDTADQDAIERLEVRLKKLQDQQKRYFIPNEIDRLYTENGGLDMNASTGQDITTYKVSLPSNKIELWARIESDRLQSPVFREFYTERQVVMEERRQRVESDPDGKFYEQFMKTAYTRHPYGRPILGWPEDLMRLTPEKVRRFFQKYKERTRTVIAVVGDIDPEKTLSLIEKYFGSLPARMKEKTIVPVEPIQKEERRVKVFFDASPMIMIGFHKPAAPFHHDYVFDVLETVLARGRTSRLFNLLVKELQVAEDVDAYNGVPAARQPNLFIISAKPRYPHTNAELGKIILAEIEKIKTQPLADLELIKAKNQLRMQCLRSLGSNQEIASTISYYEVLLGDYRYIFDYLTVIETVSNADIQGIAQLYLTKENRTVGVLTQQREP
ncbi:MAG: insulinase family protein [Deltaproteobacteria bacterium]|nr:insulinase family protein [Deltaproteobacteria bacterium]